MTNRKALVLDLIFATTPAYERFLRDLAKEVDIQKTVVRGRVTPSGAWMKIALFGDAERIDGLQQRWSGWTLTSAA